MTQQFEGQYEGGEGLFVFRRMLFFYHWIGWHFGIFVVTNMRLLYETQDRLSNRGTIDVGVFKIENISYNILGFSTVLPRYDTLVTQAYVCALMRSCIRVIYTTNYRVQPTSNGSE